MNSPKISTILLLKALMVTVLAFAGTYAEAKKDGKKDRKKDHQEETYSWDKIDLRENLYEKREKEIYKGKNIDAKNEAVLWEIQNYAPFSESRTNGITLAQAQLITRLMNQNSVTGSVASQVYDPQGIFGFCFGRALYAHLELLRHGVSKDSIKKAFVVGPMKSAGIDWQFHVATIVRAADQDDWYVIDNLGSIKTVEPWFRTFQKMSIDKQLRLYITNPAKIGPDSWEYNIKPGGLFDPGYNNYFKDMFETFKANPIPDDEKF